MAAISITASKVRPLHGAIIRRYKAASTNVAVGKPVYVTSAGKIELADADDVAQCQARGVVVAVATHGATTAAVDEMCDVVVHGPVEISTGLTDGAPVYVSPTAGALDQTPSATTGDFNYIVGYAESDTVLYVQPQMVVPTAV